MSAWSHQNYTTEMEAMISRLISMHLEVSDKYLSLAFLLKDNRSVGGLVHFFRDLSEEKRQAAYLLLMQTRQSDCDRFSNGPMMLSYRCDGSVDAMETSLALEKNLNQLLLDLHALGSANADFQLCHFLEKHFLEKEMNLIKKISDYLANLRQQASEEENLSECLFTRLSLNSD